jgi:hypothetical protein
MGQATEGPQASSNDGDGQWLNSPPHRDCWKLNLAGIQLKAMEVAGTAPQVERVVDYIVQPLPGDVWSSPEKRQMVIKPQLTAQPLDWPPGFAGEIARYVYGAAMRPVKEVAIVAALGLLAGVCGRQWQIPQSGLNLYLVLIARSAIGKEAMLSGISSLMAGCRKGFPNADQFVDFMDYASGPALTKGCISRPSFVNVNGELGKKFKRWAQDGRDSALQSLKTQVTNLYAKSGATSITGGLGYSNTENNVESLMAVAYSLMGETTPGTFLESLSSDMMEDGFLSRFTMVEYEGDRPAQNPAPLSAPPDALVQHLVTVMDRASNLYQHNHFVPVLRGDSVGVTLDLFNLECDRHINSTRDESRRQMWNRAHLKALRIAALFAVADNHIAPVVTQAHADWAINLVLRDITTFTKRLDGGDVGGGDDAREGKLLSIIRAYLLTPVPESYKVSDDMRKNSIVPLNYLQKKTQHAPAFSKHPLQAKRALDETLRSLVDAGYLMEVQKDKLVKSYNCFARAYRILRSSNEE